MCWYNTILLKFFIFVYIINNSFVIIIIINNWSLRQTTRQASTWAILRFLLKHWDTVVIYHMCQLNGMLSLRRVYFISWVLQIVVPTIREFKGSGKEVEIGSIQWNIYLFISPQALQFFQLITDCFHIRRREWWWSYGGGIGLM